MAASASNMAASGMSAADISTTLQSVYGCSATIADGAASASYTTVAAGGASSADLATIGMTPADIQVVTDASAPGATMAVDSTGSLVVSSADGTSLTAAADGSITSIAADGTSSTIAGATTAQIDAGASAQLAANPLLADSAAAGPSSLGSITSATDAAGNTVYTS